MKRATLVGSAMCVALAILPLSAQGNPEARVDSASFGLGYGTQGILFTTMRTGPQLGYFLGLSALPSTSSPGGMEPGSGSPRWIQHEDGRSGAHLGVAYRLDTRWVVGLGLGYASTQYRYSYNPGAAFFPASTAVPEPGPLADNRFGAVAMVDLRLGPRWGVEVVGGVTGLGASVTFRF